MAAIGNDSHVYVCGDATALGLRSDVRTLTRIDDSKVGTAVAVACGRDCTFILNNDGAVFSIGGGGGGKGKLGFDTTANQPVPVKIASGGAISIFGGCSNYGGGYVTDQFYRGIMDPSDTNDEEES